MKSTCLTDEYGDKRWYCGKKLHRENGPAIEYTDGSKEWWVDGKYHRVDGPAIEQADGTKFWYIKGECHRLDGPAVEYASGTKQWFIDGNPYTEEQFDEIKMDKNYKGEILKVFK